MVWIRCGKEVISVAIIATVPYAIAVSNLRRPFLSDRHFFIAVRLLRRREKFTGRDFTLLARAFNRARTLHPFYLTAWVFLPDHWHCICAPLYPVTISLAMKSVKQSSTSAVNQRRGAGGELWQPRFFDRALRTVKEHNEKVEYIHLNPVRAGLVSRPADWRWSSYNEYANLSADQQLRTRWFDRRPSQNALRSAHTNLTFHHESEKTRTTNPVVRATSCLLLQTADPPLPQCRCRFRLSLQPG